MNLGILSYVFMVIIIMAFSNIAGSNAEALPSELRICRTKPRSPLCRG
uniref:Venom peptide n=1 Tax=Dasymutilla occidentalis TaxID=374947 RepID=A0A8T9VUG7_DASOC|nr:venom peptide precursor [Dasymutilla occidentalis]